MPTGNGENFTDSERLQIPKMDCALKILPRQNSISLNSRFVDLENSGFTRPTTLIGNQLVLHVVSYWMFR